MDNLGNEYEIVVDDHEFAPILKLHFCDGRFERKSIGYANLFDCGDALRLQDIRISDDAILISRSRFFFFFERHVQEARNFQRRGLGTELLKSVFQFARAKGYQSIVGEIVRRDLEKNPKLPEWYAKNGFAVNKTERGFDIVAQWD